MTFASDARPGTTRRRVLRLWLALPPALLAACGGDGSALPASTPAGSATRSGAPEQATRPAQPATAAQATAAQAAGQVATLAATPSCADADDATPQQTAGPFFTPNSPQRVSLLEPGMAGAKIVLGGRVLATDCRPVARALLDFWQADAAGAYDNAGYKLRGHQFAGDAGQYTLETVIPGLYPGRTRHFHVRVQAPNRPALTTQLYFPNEPRNASDSIFHPDLVLKLADAAGGKVASFDFVLDLR